MIKLSDFYFIFFPIGNDFIQTMLCTFKYVPQNCNIIVITPHCDLIKDVNVSFNLIVLNIDDLRDDWSKKNEIVIYGKNSEKYINKVFENQKKGIKFPYGLHRYIIPWLANKNITKFAILDADCLINYNNELEFVFNSLSEYCGNDQYSFGPTMSISSNKKEYLTLSKDVLNEHGIDVNVINNMPEKYYCFDGYLRGFWFNNVSDVMLFYYLWDGILKKSYDLNSSYINQNYTAVSDEWLVGLVSYILSVIKKIKIEDLVFHSHRLVKHIYHPENYFFQLHHGLYHTPIKEGGYGLVSKSSRKEFYDENEEKLIRFYSNVNGIIKERISEVIYDYRK